LVACNNWVLTTIAVSGDSALSGGGLSRFIAIEIKTAEPIIATGNNFLNFLFKSGFLSLGDYLSASWTDMFNRGSIGLTEQNPAVTIAPAGTDDRL
jgi:hypothetical protein